MARGWKSVYLLSWAHMMSLLFAFSQRERRSLQTLTLSLTVDRALLTTRHHWVALRCINASSPGSERGGRADSNQPTKHSIADKQTQGNIQYWFGSAAVQQNICDLWSLVTRGRSVAEYPVLHDPETLPPTTTPTPLQGARGKQAAANQ